METDIGLLDYALKSDRTLLIRGTIDGWLASSGTVTSELLTSPSNAAINLASQLSTDELAITLPPSILVSDDSSAILQAAMLAWAQDSGEQPAILLTWDPAGQWVASLFLSGTELLGSRLASTHLCSLMDIVLRELRLLGYGSNQVQTEEAA